MNIDRHRKTYRVRLATGRILSITATSSTAAAQKAKRHGSVANVRRCR